MFLDFCQANNVFCCCPETHNLFQELKRRWTSILHHICGIHRWEEDGQERTCYHQDLTEEQQRRKKWLQKDSAAFKTLSDHVLNKNLLKDLKHMTLFKHTGTLCMLLPCSRSFTLLVYCTKINIFNALPKNNMLPSVL